MVGHVKLRLRSAFLLGAIIIPFALGVAGCRGFEPGFTLGGVGPGMTEAEVSSSLGQPERWVVEPDFLWWFYENGVTVGLHRNWPKDGTVAWVVQTKGSHSEQIAIGDPMEKVAGVLGPDHPVVTEGGRRLVRFAGQPGQASLDFLFTDGLLAAMAVYSAPLSEQSPPPDPALFPEFAVQGVRLLMTGPEVVGILGEPPVRKTLSCWESWRYPDLGLTVDLAQAPGVGGTGSSGAPDVPRVIWAMQTAKKSTLMAGRYCPPDREGGPPFRDRVAVANQDGDTITFYYGDGGKPVALVLAQSKESLRRPEASGLSQADPEQLAGLRLGMTTEQVQAVLGEPDRRSDGDTYSHWEYFEDGLWVVFVISVRDGPLRVTGVTQSRGAWFTIPIGDTAEEAQRRLGKGLSPGTIDDSPGIRYELDDRSFFLVAISGGTVIYFHLSVGAQD